MMAEHYDWQSKVRYFVQTAQKPLIVVLGPTASGKTGFSIELAQFIARICQKKVEVINADSRQLYKFLDRGTAKITQEEMAGVPHHLFSVLDPHEPVSIGWYQREASALIDKLHAQKHVPILVGGSMLYISSIIDGLQPQGASDKVLRARLQVAYDADGGIALHQQLTAVDPVAAAGIPRENSVYLLRALEIYKLTGKKPSDAKKKSQCPYDLLIFGIHRSREDLVNRINQRTCAMMDAGWIEEVQGLLKNGYSIDDPAMESSGYPEIIAYIQNGGDQKILIEKIAAKTRQYAKRQMTWWRGDERIIWL